MTTSSLKEHLKLPAPVALRLSGFWHWWVGELIGILPEAVRETVLPSAENLYLQTDGTALIASHGTNGDAEEIGRYQLGQTEPSAEQAQEVREWTERSREVILYLPANKVLTRSLTLPLVAEANLHEVLGFEMDRQTPFGLDQVYYDQTVTGRNPKDGILSVELVLTPRPYLDDLLERLRHIGFHPGQVSVVHKNGDRPQAVNLLPAGARKRRRNPARQINLALGILILVLLAGTSALPLMKKARIINALEATVEQQMREAQAVQKLREEVDQLTTGSDFLAKKKLGAPLTIEIIDELTRILPDNTWLNQLTIKGSEVQIQGYSATAATLIPTIQSSPRFQNPQFRSSVTATSRDSDSERFHLSAELTGR